MRVIPGPIPGETREFLPECFGNREDDTPITVTLRQPTERQKRSYQQLLEVTRDEGEKTQVKFTEEWKERILLDCVVRVKNYKDAAGKFIKTAEDLLEGEQQVVDEVAAEAVTGYSLDPQEKKDSSEQPGSSAGATPPSAGTVKSANGSGQTSVGVVASVPVESISLT